MPLHTTSLRPSSLKSIFTSLRSLTLDTLPEADEPLVPSIAELKARAGIKTDSHADAEGSADEEEAGHAIAPATPQEESDAQASASFSDGPALGIEIDTDTLYMAICTSDSTVVYYKLSRGIKKPADIPDE